MTKPRKTKNSAGNATGGSQPSSLSPNGAENDDNCKDCNSVLTDDDMCIFCNRCKRWICIGCLGISSAAYDSHVNSPFKSQGFYCPSCQPLAAKAVETDLLIDEKISCLESRVEERFEKIELELGKKANQDDLLVVQNKMKGLSHISCDNKLAEVQRDIAQLSRQLNDLINEPIDAAHRAKNVIARNVPETNGSDDQLTDVDKVAEVMGAIGVAQRPSLTRRLGQASDERSRPVLLRFEEREVAASVLANAKKLAEADQQWLNRVYLDPDRTKIEGLRRKNHIERVEKQAVRMNAVGKDVYRQGTRIFYNSSRPKPQYQHRVGGHPANGRSSNSRNGVTAAANGSTNDDTSGASLGAGGAKGPGAGNGDVVEVDVAVGGVGRGESGGTVGGTDGAGLGAGGGPHEA